MDIPNHIGLILDGNRRWARARGLATYKGHEAGYENLKKVANHCFNLGVKIVSAFVFSTENWKRAKTEVDFLMGLLKKALTEEAIELNKKGVRIKVFGLRDSLNSELKELIDKAEKLTEQNKKGTLCLCLNYGGRAEILEAVKKIIGDKVTEGDVDEKKMSEYLWTRDIEDPDIIIRISGEMRLSGFLTWQSVYSELFFSPKMWPEFATEDLDGIIEEFNGRKRRFGGG